MKPSRKCLIAAAARCAALLVLAAVVAVPAPGDAAQVRPLLPFSKKVALAVPAGYTFRFSLLDAPLADPAHVLWSEQKWISLSTTTLEHTLGSVVAIDPALFDRQLWVSVERRSAGAWLAVGGTTRLTVSPYAMSSLSLPVGAVGTEELLDGSVSDLDLADGAALAEILDDAGSESGLDADLLDGTHGGGYAAAGHAHDYAATDHGHDAVYVNEGQADGVTAGMIADGAVADTALSANVALLDGSQTFVGIPTFNPAAGAVPFAVDASKNGMVANLHAAQAADAARIGGQDLADLDARYGVSAAPQLGPLVPPAVDTEGDVGLYASLTIGADGLPIISYYDTTNGDLKVLHCGSAGCTSGNTATTVDADGDVGLFTTIVIGTDGLPLVSYWDVGNEDVKVLHCGNAACTSGNTVTIVDSAGRVGWYTALAIGGDGLPLIAYMDNNASSALKILHCGDTLCTSGNTATTAAPGITSEPSMTIGTDGLPVISYLDYNGSRALMVLHCGNAGCSSGNTQTAVDSTPQAGFSSSIAIGADGFPIVSYHTDFSHDLKVAHCGDATCTSGNTVTTVDAPGHMGYYSSITIGADGNPIVSYHDGDKNDLKILRCGNAACSAGNVIVTADTAGGDCTSIAMGVDGIPVVAYHAGDGNDLKVARGFVRPLGRR